MTALDQACKAYAWIEVLKMTTLKQGKGKLGDCEIGFCCLGVGAWLLDIDYLVFSGASALFKDEVGLLQDNGSSGKYYSSGSAHISKTPLVVLNDDKGYTFKEISKHLEKYYKNYFTEEVVTQLDLIYKGLKL